tara:strand:- start:2538 stop:3395 length:858 start_codon:yes stop_codon:yes gene_type:complete
MNKAFIHYSYAKVNLGLKILNKRPDNYHNIHSLFIEINLSDELTFFANENHKLSIKGPTHTQFPLDENNLITKAYKLMRNHLNFNELEYAIQIKKNIPIGSGLGGGSSNAATTLKVLNELWNMGFSNKKLEQLGVSLGADIPFFINGGLQLIEGIGETLSPQKNDFLRDLYFLLIIPSIYVSTKEAYSSLNKPLHPIQSYSKFSPVSRPVNWQLFDNDFENVIGKTYPEIHELKIALKKNGALFSGLSGSGSTVFGIFDSLQKADIVEKKFSNYQTFLTSPVFHS